MKIAFTAKSGHIEAEMEARFGRTPFFVICDTEKNQWNIIDNRDIQELGHGAGPKSAQRLLEAGADVLITGNGPGEKAALILKQSRLEIYTIDEDKTIGEAMKAFENNSLTKLNL